MEDESIAEETDEALLDGDKAHPWIVDSWGDGLELKIPGVATLTAEYEAEGCYEEAEEGEPQEQDLFRIQVAPARRGSDAPTLSFPLLLPLTEEIEEPDDALVWVRRYLEALAEQLAEAPGEEWEAICDASRTWSPAELLDVE